ncbi:hypothetical protein [Methanobrevibacter sp. DSM 116169]|uniref:hypothetical protein n=1 Tax=Methanobrevibacter sp. DSM 116169 TaxID=3242727 RepID=UPI0038FCC272
MKSLTEQFTEKELEELEEYFDKKRKHLKSNPEAAREYLREKARLEAESLDGK